MDVNSLYYHKYRSSFRLGTYIALLKTMSIAHLVKQLYGASTLPSQTFSRLSKTRHFIKVLIQSNIDSPESKKIIEHINHVHAGITASNEDYLYVLSVFILEPMRLNRIIGKRCMQDAEITTLIAFWHAVGVRMNISNLPLTESCWITFQQNYEAKHQTYSPEGHALALKSLQEVVKLSLPFGIRSIAKQLILGAVTKQTLSSLGLKTPWLPFAITRKIMGIKE